MATQVTQCPKCNTSFRVTEAQLNIANGAVRCGSCLHIFNASEHWLNSELAPRPQPEPQASEPASTQSGQPTAIAAETEADENDFNSIFNDEFISEEPDFDFAEDQPATSSQAENTDTDQEADHPIDEFQHSDASDSQPEQLSVEIAELDDQPAAEVKPHAPSVTVDEDEDRYGDDDDILIDDDELINDTNTRSIINTDDDLYDTDYVDDNNDAEPLYSETFRSLDQDELRASAIFKDLDDMGEDHKDEDWTKKLLEDDEPETESTVYQQPDQDEPIDDEPDPFSNLFDALDNEPEPRLDPDLLNILNDDGEDSDAPMDEFVLGDEPMLAGERIGSNHHQLLANIEPEPVFMAAANQRSQWINRAWVAAIVAAMLLLAAQYTYFNFERLARDKTYRPALSSLCSLVGCTIPNLHNIQLIRSSNLMVRSHPKINQALVVDAIITNRAEFPQRFPILELQFTDLEGNIVAGRHFQPEEYLGGELRGSQTMPMKQPVHIALEIVDPGQQAVNYQLYFHPPQDS